jgi:hypothetical protein
MSFVRLFPGTLDSGELWDFRIYAVEPAGQELEAGQ